MQELLYLGKHEYYTKYNYDYVCVLESNSGTTPTMKLITKDEAKNIFGVKFDNETRCFEGVSARESDFKKKNTLRLIQFEEHDLINNTVRMNMYHYNISDLVEKPNDYLEKEIPLTLERTALINYKTGEIKIKAVKTVTWMLEKQSWNAIKDFIKRSFIKTSKDFVLNRESMFKFMDELSIEFEYVNLFRTVEIPKNIRAKYKEKDGLSFVHNSRYHNGTNVYLGNLALILYSFVNPGIENLLKSDIYRAGCYQDIIDGKTFPKGKLHQLIGIDKTTNKFINKLIDEFHSNFSNLNETTLLNKNMFCDFLSIELHSHKDEFDKFVKFMKGYNNASAFVEEFYYWNFFQSYFLAKQRLYYYGENSEERIKRITNNMFNEFIRTVIELNRLFKQSEEYTLDIPTLTKYICSLPRKQGFSSIADGIVLLRDYVTMCKTMKGRWQKYPAHINTVHNIAELNFKLFSKQTEDKDMQKFQAAVQNYLNLEYSGVKDDKFSIVAPANSEELFIEGASLNHCVASYIGKVIDGSSKILFLRKKENLQNPFFTIEVVAHNILNVKGLAQIDIDKETDEFVKKWASEKNLIRMYDVGY